MTDIFICCTNYQSAVRGATGQAFLNIMLRGFPRLNDVMRDELVRFLKDRDLFQLGTAHVVLLDGLAGATMRAFLSTLILMTRPKNPVRVFGDRGDASTWLLMRMRSAGDGWTSGELKEAYDEAVKDL